MSAAGEARPAGAPAQWHADPSLGTVRLALLGLYLLVIARLAWVSDDAFISFRTVWNLVHGYGLRWNVDERVQAFTNPLWLFLVSGVYAITREIFVSSILLSLLVSSCAVAVTLYRLCTTLPRALAFVTMLLASQAILDYSTSGLENPLSFLLVAIFCALWLPAPSGSRPIFRLFLVGSLLVLNRQDTVLLVAPALAQAWVQSWSWPTFRRMVLGLLPIVAWEVFSIVYYGFPFPNTYYAKLSTGISGHDYMVQGWVFMLDVLTHDPATLLIVILSAFTALFSKPRAALAPLGVGLLLYAAYVVSVGGDFMQGRFLSVPAFLGAILLAQGRIGVREHTVQPLLMAAIIVAATSLRYFTAPAYDPPIRVSGMADERRYYADTNSLVAFIRGQTVPENHPWTKEARAWRDNPREHVFVAGAIGMQGWTVGPKVHLVDWFGLSDPLIARISAITPWRIGHFQRVVPNDYLESIRSGQNRFHTQGLAHLYDQLQVITRGPVFSWARAKAIWELNLHHTHVDPHDEGERFTLALAQLATPKADGYPWDGPGTFQVFPAGVDVTLTAPSHATSVSLSADNNDRYRLQFLTRATAADRVLGEATAPEWHTRDGLTTRQVPVPPAARVAGFDLVRILPEGGDNSYSIGALILNGDPAETSPETLPPP